MLTKIEALDRIEALRLQIDDLDVEPLIYPYASAHLAEAAIQLTYAMLARKEDR